MLKDQKELLALLNEHGVEYMVVGGHADGAHAEPRLTKDLDILIRNDRQNCMAAFRVLAMFGTPLQGISPEDFFKPTSLARKTSFETNKPLGRLQDLADVESLRKINDLA